MVQENGVRPSLEPHSNDTGGYGHELQLGKTHWMLGKALSLSRWKPQEQVVERHCGMPVLGDSENPTGHSCEEPALTTPLLHLGRETVGPLEDPSYLSASVIP